MVNDLTDHEDWVSLNAKTFVIQRLQFSLEDVSIDCQACNTTRGCLGGKVKHRAVNCTRRLVAWPLKRRPGALSLKNGEGT